MQFKPWYPPAEAANILHVSALILAVVHIMCDLEAEQMNLQHCLIQELRLHKFGLGNNVAEETLNFCCAKGESAVNHSIVTRVFKKCRLDCKILDDQAKPDKPKTFLSPCSKQKR